MHEEHDRISNTMRDIIYVNEKEYLLKRMPMLCKLRSTKQYTALLTLNNTCETRQEYERNCTLHL